ncbi:MAG: sodium:calcium antiporter [Pseudomonas sp.]
MLTFILELLGMLLVILIAAELFTNALEHFGERLGISEGVTGSLFAAVGTALPETLIPLLALIRRHQQRQPQRGSRRRRHPWCATDALYPVHLPDGARRLARSRPVRTHPPERTGLQRDLNFFLVAFSFATIAMFVPAELHSVRVALSVLLVLTYVGYITLTIRASQSLVEDGHGTEADHHMYLSRIGLPTNLATILLQLLLGLVLLVLGAKGFIHGVEGLSHILGISALLLSLLIIPIATELPEKINSILWVRRGKDTLAFGNISGAMVFQGTLLPAIGILLTPWQPRIEVLTGVLVTLGAALWLRINAQRGGGLPIWVLMLNGVLYAAYLGITRRADADGSLPTLTVRAAVSAAAA